MMTAITSVSQFESEVLGSKSVGVVVSYWGSWCEPSVTTNDYLKKVIADYEGVNFVTIDVDTCGDVCEKNGVETVPFVAFYRPSGAKQELAADVSGAKLQSVEQNLKSLYGLAKDRRSAFENIDDYIKHLLNKDKVVIFITGTPSHPICGFTTKLVGLMAEKKVPYTYVDIMSDNELCDRLKAYSNWPTYPQIYADGALVGGLDIVLELVKEGEFDSTFGVSA